MTTSSDPYTLPTTPTLTADCECGESKTIRKNIHTKSTITDVFNWAIFHVKRTGHTVKLYGEICPIKTGKETINTNRHDDCGEI